MQLRPDGVKGSPLTLDTLIPWGTSADDDKANDIMLQIFTELDVDSQLALSATNRRLNAVFKKIEPVIAEGLAKHILQDDSQRGVALAFLAVYVSQMDAEDLGEPVLIDEMFQKALDPDILRGMAFRLKYIPDLVTLHYNVSSFVHTYWKTSCFPIGSSEAMTPTELARQNRWCFMLEIAFVLFQTPLESPLYEFEKGSDLAKTFRKCRVKRPTQALVRLVDKF